MCKMSRAFADGTLAQPHLNNSWLAVLPKGSDPMDRGGNCARPAENMLYCFCGACGPPCGASCTPREGSSLAEIRCATCWSWTRMCSMVPSGDLPLLLLCDMAAAFPSVSRRWLRPVLEFIGLPEAKDSVRVAVNDGMIRLLSTGGVVIVSVTSGI